MQRIICPLDEKLKRKASPFGNAVEELIDVEISLTSVWRGLKNTLNALRLTSAKNLCLSESKLSEYGTLSCVAGNDGQRAKW